MIYKVCLRKSCAYFAGTESFSELFFNRSRFPVQLHYRQGQGECEFKGTKP